MLLYWDMDELEVKKQNHGDSVIDHCIRLYIRVIKHTSDIESIHLYCEFADPNKMKVHCVECAEEAVEFDFCLRIVGLALIPGNGAKVQGVAAAVSIVLRQDLSDALDR